MGKDDIDGKPEGRVSGRRASQIVASQVGGQWYNHHYDARGHCILLTTATGGLEQQYDYDAFGFPYFYTATGAKLTSAVKTRFLFTGREWLSDLRVYDYRHRHYQPELGRFLQPDPKHFAAGDYNLYRYCHNDPVNKSDPTGLSWGTNLSFLARWLLGVGPKQENYKEDSVQTREMADSPGAKTLKDRFEKGNGKDVQRHAYGTTRAYKETVVDPKTADWSKTGALMRQPIADGMPATTKR